MVDRAAFRPYKTGVAMLLALKAEAKDRFQWRNQPYEFVTDRPAIDLLTGTTAVREAIEQDAPLEDIRATWQDGEKAFEDARNEHFLY